MTIKEYIKAKKKEVKNNIKHCVALAVEDMKNKGYSDSKIKRMTIDDKWLYYKLNLDSNCKMPKDEDIQWVGHIEKINFICNTENRYNNFMNNFYGKSRFGNIMFDLIDFVKYQIEVEKRNEYISPDILQECINNEKWDQFHELMNELFMDNIYWGVFEATLEMIGQGLTGEDIYKWSKIEPNPNFVCFDLEYVKEKLDKMAC